MGSAQVRIKQKRGDANRALTAVLSSFSGLLLLVGPAIADEVIQTPTLFKPISEPAFAIMDFGLLIIWICAGIFFIVFGLLMYTIIRYRAKAGDESLEPAQIYGSEQLELAWPLHRSSS